MTRNQFTHSSLVVLAVATAGWHSTVLGGHHHGGKAREIRVVAAGFSFTPSDLRLAPGTYRFVIVNRDLVFHDFRVQDLKTARGVRAEGRHRHITTAEADPGETGTTTIELSRGVYLFMCHVPGHVGMWGRIVVGDADAGTARAGPRRAGV